MNEFETNVLQMLQEIKELLEPISGQHKEAFLHDKINLLRDVITPKNTLAFRLLFDPRNLTQQQIAREADVSQPTVSRLINELLNRNLLFGVMKVLLLLFLELFQRARQFRLS